LYIHQDGALAGANNALLVYSNAIQISGTLFKVQDANASSTHTVSNIINAGTGNNLRISQDGVLAVSKYALDVQSNNIQVNSALVRFLQEHASATANVFEIDNDGTGHGLYIQQDGNLASGKYALYINNNGTPADGAGRAIRLDGCTVSGTGAILGYIGVNIDGTQRAVPYYAIA